MHHVLPAINYFVKMLDSHIVQLRTCGLKVYITLDTAIEVKKEFKEVVVAAGDPEFSIVFQSHPRRDEENAQVSQR